MLSLVFSLSQILFIDLFSPLRVLFSFMPSSFLRLIAFVAALLGGGLILAGWMGLSTLARAAQEVRESAIRLSLDDIARSLSAQAALGIAPAQQGQLARLIAAEVNEASGIWQIRLNDGQGTTLFESPAQVQAQAPERPLSVVRLVKDDLGQSIAGLEAIYDSQPQADQIAALARGLAACGLALWLGLCLIAILVLRRITASAASEAGDALPSARESAAP